MKYIVRGRAVEGAAKRLIVAADDLRALGHIDAALPPGCKSTEEVKRKVTSVRKL